MECRIGCGACCIAASISSQMPELPEGKPAGTRCLHLTDDNRCRLFGMEARPLVCRELKPSVEMCGTTFQHAYDYLSSLERETMPE
jgi:uncharacterized protein